MSIKTILQPGWLAVVGVFVLLQPAGIVRAGSAQFDKQMLPILEQYLKIPEVLAADKTDGVTAAGALIKKLAAGLDSSSVSGEHAKHYRSLPAKLKKSAGRLQKAKGIEALRQALKELSKPMAMWASMSKPKGISVVYCSMAPGSWLQNNTTIANPYYGAKMLRCGEIVSGEGAGKVGQHQH